MTAMFFSLLGFNDSKVLDSTQGLLCHSACHVWPVQKLGFNWYIIFLFHKGVKQCDHGHRYWDHPNPRSIYVSHIH